MENNRDVVRREVPSHIDVLLEQAQVESPRGYVAYLSDVTLVHDRFPRKTTTYRRFSKAHPIAMSALEAWVEDGELPLRAKLYTLIFKPGMKTFTVRAEPW